MKKIDKYILLGLGFEEIHVTEEESGDKAFVYYVFDLDEFDSLISNSVFLPLNGSETFVVNLFNTELGYCKTEEELKILYKVLKGKEWTKE